MPDLAASIADLSNRVSALERTRTVLGGWQYAETVTSESTTTGTYTNLGTVGPTITIPLTATYLVGVGAAVANSASGQEAWMSYTIDGATAIDADAVKFSNVGTVNKSVAVARFTRKALTAGDVLEAKYRVGGGTGSWESRWLLAIPLP